MGHIMCPDLVQPSLECSAIDLCQLRTPAAAQQGGETTRLQICYETFPLGLHRQALRRWHLSDSEIQERNRLFWVVYDLDKTISLRCGRPSVSLEIYINLNNCAL